MDLHKSSSSQQSNSEKILEVAHFLQSDDVGRIVDLLQEQNRIVRVIIDVLASPRNEVAPVCMVDLQEIRVRDASDFGQSDGLLVLDKGDIGVPDGRHRTMVTESGIGVIA